jgi:hypothetical protein
LKRSGFPDLVKKVALAVQYVPTVLQRRVDLFQISNNRDSAEPNQARPRRHDRSLRTADGIRVPRSGTAIAEIGAPLEFSPVLRTSSGGWSSAHQ